MWRHWIQKGLLGLSLVLGVFLTYLLLHQVESAPPPGTVRSAVLGQADSGIQQFQFVQSRDGKLQWKVQAQRAHVYESENRAVLEGVDVTLFGKDGWAMTMQGDQGTIDTARKDFLLVRDAGLISVQLDSGYTILTNNLVWTNDRGEISTQEPVKIVGHGVEVTGRGLVGRLDHEEFQVLEDVLVEIQQ